MRQGRQGRSWPERLRVSISVIAKAVQNELLCAQLAARLCPLNRVRIRQLRAADVARTDNETG
jgi:hypothetical protein